MLKKYGKGNSLLGRNGDRPRVKQTKVAAPPLQKSITGRDFLISHFRELFEAGDRDEGGPDHDHDSVREKNFPEKEKNREMKKS